MPLMAWALHVGFQLLKQCDCIFGTRVGKLLRIGACHLKLKNDALGIKFLKKAIQEDPLATPPR